MLQALVYKSTGSWYLCKTPDGRYHKARIKGRIKIDRSITSTNPVAVGDEVEVLEVKGRVEKVGLRITSVRSSDNTLWYLRNGEILKVGNKSQIG